MTLGEATTFICLFLGILTIGVAYDILCANGPVVWFVKKALKKRTDK